MSEAELQRLVLVCDRDRNGVIDYNEFVTVFGSGDVLKVARGQHSDLPPVRHLPPVRRERENAWLTQRQDDDRVLQSVRTRVGGDAAQMSKVRTSPYAPLAVRWPDTVWHRS
jgi:hypothetical protein